MTSSFTFVGYDQDVFSGVFAFHYRLIHEGKTIEFTEQISVDPALIVHKPDLTPILNSLLLILGISYWKTYCPKEIIIEPFFLTGEQAAFWNTVYTKGLGEFFYRNQIDFRGLIQFPSVAEAKSAPIQYEVEDRSLVPLGGGKDSLVTAELLKKQKKSFALFAVSPPPLLDVLATRVGVPFLKATREIDPKLLELNRQPGVFNGHIPITGVRAFIDVLVAALAGYASIVISNEESANYGNVQYMGEEMNHQWSKSAEFGELFASYVRSFVTPSITYISLLKDYEEIEIAEMFSHFSQYFDVFTSCNRNFTLSSDGKTPYWCGECPKCAFVFLLLSAYLPKETVVSIFHKNLYADTSLLPVFRELLGISGFKPFECVGTPEESKKAFTMAAKKTEYKEEPVIVALTKEL